MYEYLTAKFKDKELVKSLGARYDGPTKQWYVSDGLDLTPFLAWLPAARKLQLASVMTASAIAFPTTQSNSVAVLKKGISLSQLLAGVSQAIAQAYAAGVRTMVEVVSARMHSNGNGNGNVYLELSESDANGRVVAKSGAVIWSSNAGRILGDFEKATTGENAAEMVIQLTNGSRIAIVQAAGSQGLRPGDRVNLIGQPGAYRVTRNNC